MSNSGIYIALEGLDGSGKSTLFKNLIEIFKTDEISFDTLCPTQISKPNSIPEKVYRSNKKFKRLNFYRTLIFAYRSFKASSKVNWQASLILGDRSIVVTYVKHWRKIFNSPFLTVMFVNLIEPFIKSPDYVLLLDAPENILLNRITQKNVIEIDETPENLRLMKNAYQEIRNAYKISRLRKTKWIDIDSSKQPDELVQEVYAVIKSLIAK
jgi:thymidylate kinase